MKPLTNQKFSTILQKVKKFRDDREWMQFHNPKDMAEAIVIEASELLELFLWKDKSESNKSFSNKKFKEEVSDEIADVATFLIELADNHGIDIEKAIENKIKKNEKKYPVSKSKGNKTKYTKL